MFGGLFFLLNSLLPALSLKKKKKHQINPNSLPDQYTLQNIKVMKNKHKKLSQRSLRTYDDYIQFENLD